jgi:hypothetical protein
MGAACRVLSVRADVGRFEVPEPGDEHL